MQMAASMGKASSLQNEVQLLRLYACFSSSYLGIFYFFFFKHKDGISLEKSSHGYF